MPPWLRSCGRGMRGSRCSLSTVLKTRARKRFGKFFVEELAQTVGNQEAFDEEWRAIKPFLPPGV